MKILKLIFVDFYKGGLHIKFNQMVKNTWFFFCQFILPFILKHPKAEKIKQQLTELDRIKPRNNKKQQTKFKKAYIQIWKMILTLMLEERVLRGNINYLAPLQFIQYRNVYIEPALQDDIFTRNKTISAEYFITLFDLRNPKITQKVIDIFQHEMTVDVPHLESFTAGDLGEKEHG